jgi:hypothetical protein
MADDNDARFRLTSHAGRGPSGGQASDPLAELARLIGQNDPFSDLRREARGSSSQPTGVPYAGDHAASYAAEAAPPYAPAPPYDHPREAGEHPSHFGFDLPPRPQAEVPPSHADWPGSRETAPRYPHDPFALPSTAPMPPGPGEQSYLGAGYPGTSATSAAPDYAAERAPLARAETAGAPDLPPFPPPLYPSEPETGAMPPPHRDEFYDDAPRSRRKGMVTVAAVLSLAVVGTAAAFAYRSFFGGAASSAPPPIIRASAEPSKVAPPPATPDPSTNKISYDRFEDRGRNEQVIVREEKPIEPSELARSSVPRTVPPNVPTIANVPPPVPANAPSALGEPRRVRTVPIRPDQPETAVAPAAPPAPARTTIASAANPPLDLNADTPPQAAPPAARASAPTGAPPRAPSRQAARPASPAPAPNAPLSLAPDGNVPPPPATRAAPAPRAAAPARLASAPSSGGGRYLVQVSSQRSEADAEAAFRNIQAKFRSVLGGQAHTIRRADLGSKGVYYRAMVGPFGTRDEAVQLCSSLKAAGGDCIVH